jgi:hypothetical protein
MSSCALLHLLLQLLRLRQQIVQAFHRPFPPSVCGLRHRDRVAVQFPGKILHQHAHVGVGLDRGDRLLLALGGEARGALRRRLASTRRRAHAHGHRARPKRVRRAPRRCAGRSCGWCRISCSVLQHQSAAWTPSTACGRQCSHRAGHAASSHSASTGASCPLSLEPPGCAVSACPVDASPRQTQAGCRRRAMTWGRARRIRTSARGGATAGPGSAEPKAGGANIEPPVQAFLAGSTASLHGRLHCERPRGARRARRWNRCAHHPAAQRAEGEHPQQRHLEAAARIRRLAAGRAGTARPIW